MVVLVIHHCVNAMKAKMEMARSVEDDGCEVYESVGCKAEGKYERKCGQPLLLRKIMPAWYH